MSTDVLCLTSLKPLALAGRLFNAFTSLDLASMASHRVRFAAELASPLEDRPRRTGIVYPKVAQSKGCSDRSSKDLRWEWCTLSHPSAIAYRNTMTEVLLEQRLSLPSATTSRIFMIQFDDLADNDFANLKSSAQNIPRMRHGSLFKRSRSPLSYDSDTSLPALRHTTSDSSTDTLSSMETPSR